MTTTTINVTDDELRWLQWYRRTVKALGRRVFTVTEIEVRQNVVRGKVYAFVTTEGDAGQAG